MSRISSEHCCLYRLSKLSISRFFILGSVWLLYHDLDRVRTTLFWICLIRFMFIFSAPAQTAIPYCKCGRRRTYSIFRLDVGSLFFSLIIMLCIFEILFATFIGLDKQNCFVEASSCPNLIVFGFSLTWCHYSQNIYMQFTYGNLKFKVFVSTFQIEV